MGTESNIRNKIEEIAQSYAAFTGKGSTWTQGVTLLEFSELRRMAIEEINAGLITKDTNDSSKLDKRINVPEQKPQINNYESAEEIIKEVPKDKSIVQIDDYKQTEEIKTESIMDKFNKVKDM